MARGFRGEPIRALVLHHEPDTLPDLQPALEGQSIVARRATSCGETLDLLRGPNPPHLVFTEAQLPDGTWQDVLRLAEESAAAVSVIVVSRLVDVRLYIEAIEQGACDFIVPPFEPASLNHVVRCATARVLRRRLDDLPSLD